MAEGAAVAVWSPINGVVEGGINGFSRGVHMPVGIAKPLTAVAGMGIGAVGGGIGGTFNIIGAVPTTIALKGSMTRKTFSLLDQYPKARAHAARKKMSTAEIAATTDVALNKAIEKIEGNLSRANFMAAAPQMLQEMVNVMQAR